MKKLQDRGVFLLFVYFSLLQSLNSSWVVQVLHIPAALSRCITVLVYLPFILAVGYKIFTDARKRKQAFSAVSNWIYYAFAIYYGALCVYRLGNGLEVKENLYYSIVFFGAVAIFMLLRDGVISVPRQELKKNLLWIAAYFVLYRLAYVTVGAHFFEKSPVNVNLTTGIVALLLPVLGQLLTDADRKKSWLPWGVLCASLVVIATSGSRAIFALMGALMAAMLLAALIRRKGVLRLVTAIAVGCAIVITLALANVGQVRYSIYRQTGIDFEAIRQSFTTTHPNAEQLASDSGQTTPTQAPTQAPTAAPTQAPTEAPTSTPIGVSPEQDKNAAQEQITASNWMRKLLVQRGIEEAKKNPLFGTGNVMYWYRLGEDYAVLQSSHNFLIEAIICYGLVGLMMIAALFISLLIEAKLFTKLALRRWNDTVTLLLIVVFYFAFGFVQPTVFDVFICPLFLLTVADYRNALIEG